MSEDKPIYLGPAILEKSRDHLLLLQGVISWTQHKSTERHINFQGHFMFTSHHSQHEPLRFQQVNHEYFFYLHDLIVGWGRKLEGGASGESRS